MPRIRQLNKKYRLNDLEDYIRGEMKRKGIKQSDMADKLNMSQQTFSFHLKNMDFKTGDLMDIFQSLDTEENKIGRMLKV